MSIFLGIDPGIADLGYGVIDVTSGRSTCLTYGSIRTSAGTPTAERLVFLYDRLGELLERIAIEKLFFSKNVKTAMIVAEARGVIRLCFEKRGIPHQEFSPADVKIAVCSHGGAEKKELQKMVQILLRLQEIPKPDDAADALALAMTIAFTRVPSKNS